MSKSKEKRKEHWDGKGRSKKKAKRSNDEREEDTSDTEPTDYDTEDSDATISPEEQEILKLKKQNRKLKALTKMAQTAADHAAKGQKGFREGKLSHLQDLIHQKVRKEIWVTCKHFKDVNKVKKAGYQILDMLEPVELEGLDGKTLQDGQKLWVQANEDFIAWSLNKTRNYTHGQLQKFMKEVFQQGKEDDYPNVAEIRKLAKRTGFGKKDPNRERMEKLFDVYHDELIPKVALHCRWGPSKRHHGCLSAHAPTQVNKDDPKPLPYVHYTTEAMLVWFFEAHYENWKLKFSPNSNQQAKNGGSDERAETEPNDKEAAPRETEADPNVGEKDARDGKASATSYTNPKSGRAKYGGWTEKGKKAFDNWKKEVKRARDKDNCLSIEEASLKRIRYVSILSLQDSVSSSQLTFFLILLPYCQC